MKKWDFKNTIFIAGAIFIVTSVVVAILEYHGITNYLETWP
jgi:hypothetical protein